MMPAAQRSAIQRDLKIVLFFIGIIPAIVAPRL
jgi:hypothetical protein